MSEIKDNQIIIKNEEGKEFNCDILFTYDNEKRNKHYVAFIDPNNEENVFIMIYDEKSKELFDIEDEEEFKEAEEVLNSFMELQEKEKNPSSN